MNKKIMLSANIMIAVVAITSIAFVTSFSNVQSSIADEEGATGLYKTAEDVQIIVAFEFREGHEQYTVPIFNQEGNFDAKAKPTFSIQKIVGNTPYLHKAADAYRTENLSGNSNTQHAYKEFIADIDIFAGGKHVRNLHYTECGISNFEIETLADKEEGYFGKGFAVVEDIEVECRGYTPNAIDYEQMKSETGPNSAHTLSSLDLREQAQVWNSHLRGQ